MTPIYEQPHRPELITACSWCLTPVDPDDWTDHHADDCRPSPTPTHIDLDDDGNLVVVEFQPNLPGVND